MAFNTVDGRAEYTATGGQTIFTFTFKIYTTDNVKVYLTPTGQNPDDTADLLTETTDYTVIINGDNGGDVTLVSGATAGDSVTIIRDLAVDRDYEYQANGDLTAADLNGDQDYQTYLLADGKLDISRCFQLPKSVQGVNVEVPTPEALKVFRWNATADGIENVTVGENEVYVNTLHVDTITDLLSVNTSLYGNVNAKGYNSANDGGGGPFNWDATIDKSTANGITRIDPSVSIANQGTGTGFGCWVRPDSTINIKMAGAVGDGTDSTSAFVKAATLNIPILVLPGIYLLSSDITGNFYSFGGVEIVGKSISNLYDLKNLSDGTVGRITQPISSLDLQNGFDFKGTGSITYEQPSDLNYIDRYGNWQTAPADGNGAFGEYGLVNAVGSTNLFLNSDVGVTQVITVLNATVYTMYFLDGAGTITLSGADTSVISGGIENYVTFTTTSTTLTCTVSGQADRVQLEKLSFPTPYISTGGAPVTRDPMNIYYPANGNVPDLTKGATYLVELVPEFIATGALRHIMSIYKDSNTILQVYFNTVGSLSVLYKNITQLTSSVDVGDVSNTIVKVAVRFTETKIEEFYNGVLVNTLNATIPYPDIYDANVSLGSRSPTNSANDLPAQFISDKWYPRALTDQEILLAHGA